ncbi:sulfatase [Pseudonocardia sp. NPDC049154]|uniref:sulfatase n=1 Tax=Pseudonocardia sp. NPDC049154 TaxID=3155501 RepID=UPI0033EAE0BA
MTVTSPPETAPPPASDDRPRRVRRIGSVLLTVLAAVFVLVALTTPAEVAQLEPLAFLRLPVEGLAGAALLLVLRGRARRAVALVLGALLGVLLLLRITDLGFRSVLVRPFDPVLDGVLLGNAVDFLNESFGRAGGIAALVGAGLLVVAVPVLMALAVRRLAGLLGERRRLSARVVTVLTAAWVVCAVLGAQLLPPVPFASRSAASLAWATAKQVPVSLADEREFARQAAVDAFRDTPPDQLLTALKGKDVVVAYVESYGRSAVEDPQYAQGVGQTLAQGDRDLAAAGFESRSGWLTSPIAGGGSWLAHATFLSGLWIDNQQRYRSLTSSDRLTLTKAFQQGDWRTADVMPGTAEAWPEGGFYGVDRHYDVHALGYRGLNYSWSPMPDQFALSKFQQLEYGVPGRGPLMSEVTLTSSHVPWTPVPTMRDWNSLGDGSVYDDEVRAADPPDVVWSDPARVRDSYRRTIQYSLDALVSWVKNYGNDNLVLIVLGDHQAAPIITGGSPNHDVPISVVTKDKTVLDKVAGWQWQPGLTPAPDAPVWRMDAFRDRFLDTFR